MDNTIGPQSTQDPPPRKLYYGVVTAVALFDEWSSLPPERRRMDFNIKMKTQVFLHNYACMLGGIMTLSATRGVAVTGYICI